uniref:Uncharacterized protein n=1 Tax=Rhizophora mucronata TaxID=61149 RepID=A0A2P2JCJ6_RHIMU
MLRDYLSHAIILLSSLLFQFPVCFLLPCPPHYFVARLPFSLLLKRTRMIHETNQFYYKGD